MTHKLIKTENYLLVVDESEIKEDDYFFFKQGIVTKVYKSDSVEQKVSIENFEHDRVFNYKECKKIISHLPLNGSPILEGVPLLPPYSRHQEDGIEVICKQEAEKLHDKNRHEDWGIYNELVSDDAALIKRGYNKAREKYKYTDEDIKTILLKYLRYEKPYYEQKGNVIDRFVNQLPQFMHPTEFECEMEVIGITDDGVNTIEEPKTITTAQGRQWVGKYL
jgi:hypothetical protein